jgi:imidazolonepropionase
MSLKLWKNCTLATMQMNARLPYGLYENGALIVEDDTLLWVGSLDELPNAFSLRGLQQLDANGALITPGLIDCHTHLVYGANRAAEFEMRLHGLSYEEIARSGGGIAATVKATREASIEELTTQSALRLEALLKEGVTTLEIKSGYGLSLEHERKCLQVARILSKCHAVDIRTTFLGAHALPPEFIQRSDAYIEEVIRMMGILNEEGWIDAVDAFCEHLAFTPAQVRRVFEAAQSMNLPVKLHAEQLSNSEGAALAAQFGALSCDHLEWLSEAGAMAMAKSKSVAVLLPGAYYFLRETKRPPIALLREQGVAMALSTDCNPGSSPCTSLLLMLNMACTLFRLTPEEALAGVTRNAAKALGLQDRGVLAAGKRADIVLWDIKHPAELAYAMGANPCRQTIVKGQVR